MKSPSHQHTPECQDYELRHDPTDITCRSYTCEVEFPRHIMEVVDV